MSAESILLAVISALEHVNVPYMVVGSFSSSLYGIPRSTQDADFVVQLGDVAVASIAENLGPGFELDPQVSFETITGTTRYILRHSNSAFKIELFLLSEDAHDRERFARRRRLPIFGREAWVPAPEDVVVTKLRWSRQGRRPKDIGDAKNVITMQARTLDWGYVERWCDAHGTRELLDRIRASLPPL
jgi:hypothetical protein